MSAHPSPLKVEYFVSYYSDPARATEMSEYEEQLSSKIAREKRKREPFGGLHEWEVELASLRAAKRIVKAEGYDTGSIMEERARRKAQAHAGRLGREGAAPAAGSHTSPAAVPPYPSSAPFQASPLQSALFAREVAEYHKQRLLARQRARHAEELYSRIQQGNLTRWEREKREYSVARAENIMAETLSRRKKKGYPTIEGFKQEISNTGNLESLRIARPTGEIEKVKVRVESPRLFRELSSPLGTWLDLKLSRTLKKNRVFSPKPQESMIKELQVERQDLLAQTRQKRGRFARGLLKSAAFLDRASVFMLRKEAEFKREIEARPATFIMRTGAVVGVNLAFGGAGRVLSKVRIGRVAATGEPIFVDWGLSKKALQLSIGALWAGSVAYRLANTRSKSAEVGRIVATDVAPFVTAGALYRASAGVLRYYSNRMVKLRTERFAERVWKSIPKGEPWSKGAFMMEVESKPVMTVKKPGVGTLQIRKVTGLSKAWERGGVAFDLEGQPVREVQLSLNAKFTPFYPGQVAESQMLKTFDLKTRQTTLTMARPGGGFVMVEKRRPVFPTKELFRWAFNEPKRSSLQSYFNDEFAHISINRARASPSSRASFKTILKRMFESRKASLQVSILDRGRGILGEWRVWEDSKYFGRISRTLPSGRRGVFRTPRARLSGDFDITGVVGGWLFHRKRRGISGWRVEPQILSLKRSTSQADIQRAGVLKPRYSYNFFHNEWFWYDEKSKPRMKIGQLQGRMLRRAAVERSRVKVIMPFPTFKTSRSRIWEPSDFTIMSSRSGMDVGIGIPDFFKNEKRAVKKNEKKKEGFAMRKLFYTPSLAGLSFKAPAIPKGYRTGFAIRPMVVR